MNRFNIITRSGALAGLAGLAMTATAQTNPMSLAAANTDFAFDLLKQISAGNGNGNIFISPYSVSSVLQMVADGAAGKTKAEMEHVLHLNGIPASDTAAKSLDAAVTGSQTNVTLNLANSIWYKQGVELKPEFAVRCANFFRAQTGALDFTSPQSAQTINDWAKNQTHGRITDVVQWPINPMTRVILANAIYFKGQWEHAFDPNATTNRDFTLNNGMKKQVPMMRQHRHFAYFQTENYQAVRLPYAGGRLQMYLFLPAAGSSVKQLLANFDGDTWQNKILLRFHNREGTVMLPRFKLNYAVTLNRPLESLGLKRAFTPEADFSAMADEPLYLSEVKQKSFVEVNEQGTEAAAVTTATMRALAIRMPEQPFEMVLDRPFFFVIGDETTRSILFMGIVNNPGAEK